MWTQKSDRLLHLQATNSPQLETNLLTATSTKLAFLHCYCVPSCAWVWFYEPITCRKQLYFCHGVLLTSLFLERCFGANLKCLASPTNQSAKPTDFKMVFLDFWWSFVLYIHNLILRMRPWTEEVSSFAGKTAPKVNRSVKTPWHNPSMRVAHYRTVLVIVFQWVDCFHTHDNILRGVAIFFTRMITVYTAWPFFSHAWSPSTLRGLFFHTHDHRLHGVACFHTHDHRLHCVAFFFTRLIILSRVWPVFTRMITVSMT